MVWAASSCSSSFTFDGSSSDMAQQFRNLYDTGATNASALSLSSIPSDVTERLKNHSLEFEKLPPLLQRAVLWDTGYVVPYADVASYVAPYADVAKLVTIYTLCGSGSTMADIAISQQVFYRAECTSTRCANLSALRSYTCTGTQMESVSLCAATDTDSPLNSAMGHRRQ